MDRDRKPNTQDLVPDTQDLDIKPKTVRSRTKISDPRPEICDQYLGSRLHTVLDISCRSDSFHIEIFTTN